MHLATMTAAPFVLLDDARTGGDADGVAARLYRNPRAIVVANRAAEVQPALARLREGIAAGLHAAGYLAYEAGAALMPRGVGDRSGTGPVLWFGLFDGWTAMDADALAAWLPDPAGAHATAPVPRIDRETYDAALARVAGWITAGDIYQANLTIRSDVGIAGDPLALYARLRDRSRAGHCAVVMTGEQTLLSLSPELFFALDGDRLTCQPMKGTAVRGESADGDAAAAMALAADGKQRAENLMIVDLMRNDLSRVAVAGSVAVPQLFAVETYPTIHQMTSTVTATLAPGRDAVDVIAALFPCGSITGAPKLRSMEVIAAVEGEPRGIYTGSIGRIDANGDAAFNVAIRTLALAQDGDTITGTTATLGLGSGIVADSRGDDEWAEVMAKGAFVTAGQRPVDLIETMAFDPEAGIVLLERHLARMKASAETLGLRFDRHAARNELQAATFRLRDARRVRLLLAAGGAVAVEVSAMPTPRTVPLRVAVVPLPVDPSDFRLRHKTSARGFYDAARKAAATDEVVFERRDMPDGGVMLTEGSFTSLFVRRGDVLMTPPLSAGLLPGVLRAELLDTGHAVEGVVTRADLADGFLLGNALRGLMPAVLAVAENGPARL